MDRKTPSLYEILTCNFTGDLPLEVINEEDQVILSVLDNIQRILNARAGTISHLPDYGLPDMTKILFVPVFNSDFREWQKNTTLVEITSFFLIYYGLLHLIKIG